MPVGGYPGSPDYYRNPQVREAFRRLLAFANMPITLEELPTEAEYTTRQAGLYSDILAGQAMMARANLMNELAGRGMTRSGALPAGMGQIEAGRMSAMAQTLPSIAQQYQRMQEQYQQMQQQARQQQLQALLGAGNVASAMYMPRQREYPQYRDWTELFSELGSLGFNILDLFV